MLLFCDVGEILSKSRGYHAAGAPMFWAFCFFLKKNLVTNFTDWIFQQYRNPAVIEKWEAAFRRHLAGEKEQAGIIQDMALAKMFIEEKGILVLDLTQPANGKIVDSGRLGVLFSMEERTWTFFFSKKRGARSKRSWAAKPYLLRPSMWLDSTKTTYLD